MGANFSALPPRLRQSMLNNPLTSKGISKEQRVKTQSEIDAQLKTEEEQKKLQSSMGGTVSNVKIGTSNTLGG